LKSSENIAGLRFLKHNVNMAFH